MHLPLSAGLSMFSNFILFFFVTEMDILLEQLNLRLDDASRTLQRLSSAVDARGPHSLTWSAAGHATEAQLAASVDAAQCGSDRMSMRLDTPPAVELRPSWHLNVDAV